MVTSVTGQTEAATKPLWAAKRGEHTKERKYDAFRSKCREAGFVDASLSIPIIPLVFENFGAAGPQTLEFVRGVRRHYSTQVLAGAGLAIQCVLQLRVCSTPLQLQRHLQWHFLKTKRVYDGYIGV